ncbi:hypothetical protein M9H77_19790 [Catharanthus roseus]|uniref:Uncharacterized protein n=1 Tax=Catharanthus roseus TaxID=4058 RepID=A0ACC0BBE2_CATRO|nr:hypothetical protein M9H77_19790 [Catharanthus roseus]
MGKRKGKQGEKPSSDSAGSAASGQQTLMNNLKISKIPETMLEDEKIEKGKENAESSNPNPVQKLGNSVQENQLSDKTPSENKKEGPEIDENQSSTPKASTDPIMDDQPDAALSPKPLNDQTYLPPQYN